MAKPVLVTRKRNVTGPVSFGRQIGFQFTVFNTTPVSLTSLLAISDSFSEEQQIKIRHRCRYFRKQKTSDANTSKYDLDLLGDDGDAFSGSHADLEGAAKNLFSSPPCPQPLRF